MYSNNENIKIAEKRIPHYPFMTFPKQMLTCIKMIN